MFLGLRKLTLDTFVTTLALSKFAYFARARVHLWTAKLTTGFSATFSSSEDLLLLHLW